MQELVEHLLKPICAHPDDIRMQAIEGDAALILEVVVHPEDRALLEEDGGRILRAVRTVLSAAAGRIKATVDLVDAFGETPVPTSGDAASDEE